MRLLRTQKTHDEYEGHKRSGGLNNGCVLCEAKSIEEFNYWRVIKNRFPYDRIAEVHDMLIPKRHTKEADLTEEERGELLGAKNGQYVSQNYHFIMEATTDVKSIPAHFHLHLTKIKK